MFLTWTKTCPKCKRELESSEFYQVAQRRDGLKSWCRNCENDYTRDARQSNPEKYRAADRRSKARYREYGPTILRSMKRCSDCDETKPASEFNRNRCAADGMQHYCKVCHKARMAASNKRKVHQWDEKLAQGQAGEVVALAWLRSVIGPIQDVRADPKWQKLGIDVLDGQGKSYDIKTDLLAHQTGRLFLELDGLRKSRADLWAFYLPQRGWLVLCARETLLSLAEARAAKSVAVTSARGKRTWSVQGVPVRILTLLTKTRCALFTGVTEKSQ